ncbi:hypothetical protein SNE40_008844 [Patella caerulea]
MMSLKTVGTSITALMHLEKRKKFRESGYFQRPLHPRSNPQRVLESHFIKKRESSCLNKSGSFVKNKDKTRSYKPTSKSDLFDSMGSEGNDNFRTTKTKRRNIACSSSRQESINEGRASAYVEPLKRFQKAVRKIMIMVRVVGKGRERPKETDKDMLSWTTICDDLGLTRTNYANLGLTFDPTDFKVKKKGHISTDAIEALCLNPVERTGEQIRHCLVSLNTMIPAFSEFPIKMQTSLVQVGWYEKFDPGRVIIRQGQRADNFYLILSGAAVVTILENKPKTKTSKHGGHHRPPSADDRDELDDIMEEGEEDEKEEQYVRTADILHKGSSFGEIALIQGSIRTATVTCRTAVELLALDRTDYINIFMKAEGGREPEHIQFLKRMNIFKGFALDKIPWNDPTICAFTYVRRETVLCEDSNNSELIFIIMTGTCRVIKSLPAVKPKLYRSEVRDYGLHTPRTNRTENIKVRRTFTRETKSTPGSIQLPTKSKLEADIALSRSSTILSTIARKTPQQVADDAEEHMHIINDVFKKRHVLPPIDQNDISGPNNNMSGHAMARHHQADVQDQIYIQMTKLGRGDVFGLEQVVLKDISESTSSTLISEGAECIIINKQFFRKLLTQQSANQIRKKIQPFPTEERLRQKLQTQIDWEEFKNLTILDFIDFNKHVQNVAWKH